MVKGTEEMNTDQVEMIVAAGTGDEVAVVVH
jgi:hypothetical protein